MNAVSIYWLLLLLSALSPWSAAAQDQEFECANAEYYIGTYFAPSTTIAGTKLQSLDVSSPEPPPWSLVDIGSPLGVALNGLG